MAQGDPLARSSSHSSIPTKPLRAVLEQEDPCNPTIHSPSKSSKPQGIEKHSPGSPETPLPSISQRNALEIGMLSVTAAS